MLNYIWFGLMAIALVVAAINGTADAVTKAAVDSAKTAVEIAIGLIKDLGMRGLDAGPIKNAVALESMTPVLLYMNKRYKSAGTGIHITGIPE